MKNSDLQIGTQLRINENNYPNWKGVVLEVVEMDQTETLYRIQWSEGNKKQDPIWVDIDYMRTVYTIAA